MDSGAPIMDLWPKLRRRSKGCKSKKGKSRLSSYTTRGVEKFSVIYAELQARRDSMVEKMAAQVSMVRSMSKSMRSRSVDSNYLQKDMSSSFAVGHAYEEEVSTAVSESISTEDISKLDTDSTVDTVVDNMDATDQGCHSMIGAPVSFTEQISNSDELVVMDSENIESLVKRESSLSHPYCQLDFRGGKGVSTRRRSIGKRERRWRLVDRTSVVFIIVLAVVVEKTSNLPGSMLGVLYLGVVVPYRIGTQYLPGISKFLQVLLHSHLSALATKRLDHSTLQVEEGRPNDADRVSSRHSTLLRQNSSLFSTVASPHSSPPSPRFSSFASENLTAVPSVGDRPEICESSSQPTSLEVSPASSSSLSLHTEKCASPSNKLSQFKAKLMKSYPRNKTGSDIKDRVFSMSSNHLNRKSTGFCESVGSHPERVDSCSSVALEVPDGRSTREPGMKKKSFLQRRSASRHGDGDSDISSSRTSSFSRSRFANLRVSVSHSHGVFDTTSPAYSPHTLRIGSFRISASMKESPRRSLDIGSLKPCSPGNGKVKSNKMDSMRGDHATPRQSGLGIPSPSPFTADMHEARKKCELKKCHKHEAWLAVILLVALLFLLVGRASAVLATSVSFMFLSQLDKFKNSGGAGWDRDASRRAMSISRKLQTSSYLSPHSASPRTPCTPSRDNSRSMTPAAVSDECRRSTTLDHMLRRSNTMDHRFRRSTNF